MAITDCPFCGKSFRVLGRHVHACHKRGGRSYAHLLINAKATLSHWPTWQEFNVESSNMSSPSFSPTVQSSHPLRLRNCDAGSSSASDLSCSYVSRNLETFRNSWMSGCHGTTQSVREYVVRVCPSCNKSFKRLDVHLKCSANCSKIDMAAQCVGSDLAETLSPFTAESSSTNVSMHSVDSSSIQSDKFQPLPRLKLPNSTEDWNSANNVMASELVPRVCGE